MYLFLFFLPFLLVFALYGVYAERKVSAFIQSRMGPMEVGPFGLLQTIADIIKMLLKEDIIPKSADRRLFQVAPIIVFVAVFSGFSLIPLSPDWYTHGLESGIIFIMALISLDVLGIFLAGWASNNKYSLYGAVRAVAQVVSYEIPLGLCVLSVGIWFESFDLQTITWLQTSQASSKIYFLGIPLSYLEVTNIGGFFSWTIIQNPLFLVVAMIFFIAGLAESNRAPFDLPETESEIIGGYHTEYSGFRWGIFMLAEYAMMFLIAMLTVILFLGSWASPFPDIGSIQLGTWTSGNYWGLFWLLSKTFILVFVQMWIRWTFPRLRVDQLMSLAWKYLTPFSLVLVLLIGIWKLLMA